MAHPFAPMLPGKLDEFPTRPVDRGRKRIVLSQDETHRPGQGEAGFGDDIRQRRVRRQAHHFAVADVTNVIGADCDLLHRTAVIVSRPHFDGDPRQAGDGLDTANELRRPKDASISLESRRKVGDAHFRSARIGEDGLDQRGVANVLRSGLIEIGERDLAKALLVVAGQQSREDGVRVEARETPPDDSRALIDKSGDATVADHRQVEVAFPFRRCAVHAGARCATTSSSHRRTAAGSGNAPATAWLDRPTE